MWRGAAWGSLMADKIVRASRGTMLAPETAQAYTELLVQTIWLLDQQIEHADELLGADRAHHFLRAMEAQLIN